MNKQKPGDLDSGSTTTALCAWPQTICPLIEICKRWSDHRSLECVFLSVYTYFFFFFAYHLFLNEYLRSQIQWGKKSGGRMRRGRELPELCSDHKQFPLYFLLLWLFWGTPPRKQFWRKAQARIILNKNTEHVLFPPRHLTMTNDRKLDFWKNSGPKIHKDSIRA